MADVVILTEDTAQVAAGEKYRPRPAPADQHALFAEVRPDGADGRQLANPARARLAFAAVDPASSRTQLTGIHTFPQPADGLTKDTDIDW